MNAKDLTMLDRLVESSRTKETWNNDDREALKRLRAKLGTPTEIAEALGVSTATLFRWEKSEKMAKNLLRPPPPARYLSKLKELVSAGHFDSKVEAKATDGSRMNLMDVFMRIRTVEEVMEQSQFCSRFWIIRSGKPFVIANDPKMLEFVINFMKSHPVVQAFFVYRDKKEGEELDSQELQAKLSFEAFLRQLQSSKVNTSIIGRLEGVPIFDEIDANKIGLCDPWVSYAMAEYSDAGYDKYGRSVNVWSEFAFETAQSSQFEQKKLVWLELPKNEAMMWREKRLPVFRRLLQSRKSTSSKSK